jgi:hypothetical protein
MAAMDTSDAHDELPDDDDVPDEFTDDEADYRERAAAKLDQIAQQVKQALADAGIDLDLFFILPTSGQSIVTFGTPGDPPYAEWDRVGEIVASIVAGLVGLRGTRRREVRCATT